MKESYFDYKDRIQRLISKNACFPMENERLETSPSLSQKFNKDGSFCSFYGDTVVFRLPESMKQSLFSIQKSLYEANGEILSDMLPLDSLHITLHDLSAASEKSRIRRNLELHLACMKTILQNIKENGIVNLLAKGMVSMVSTSIVMLFEPANEQVHNIIQQMYESMDQIYPLSYPLTLHCTLAYYRPGSYAPEEWNALYSYIRRWNSQNLNKMNFDLDSKEIDYQCFHSMKEYTSIDF